LRKREREKPGFREHRRRGGGGDEASGADAAGEEHYPEGYQLGLGVAAAEKE